MIVVISDSLRRRLNLFVGGAAAAGLQLRRLSANGAPHPDPRSYAKRFTGKYAHRTLTGGIGHNLPQEAPQVFADAVVEVDGY